MTDDVEEHIRAVDTGRFWVVNLCSTTLSVIDSPTGLTTMGTIDLNKNTDHSSYRQKPTGKVNLEARG